MTREQKINKIMEIQAEIEKLKATQKNLEEDLKDPSYGFEFHGTWSYYIIAKTKEEAINIFENEIYDEDISLSEDYEIDECGEV